MPNAAPAHAVFEVEEPLGSLVAGLRAMPASPVRDRISELIQSLADFAACPRCAEAQADGVPCESARTSCENCRRAADALVELRARVERR